MAGRWTDLSDILGKVIDILIAALIIFIIPASYFMMKKDVISQVGMEKETATFCENVAAQSYLTKDMYERYLNNLDTSGKKYKVSLIHRQWVYEPEYIIRSSSEIIEEDESIWEGVNEYEEVAVETDPPHIEDPIEGEDQLNKETNESILEKSKDLMADLIMHTAMNAIKGQNIYIALEGEVVIDGIVMCIQKIAMNIFIINIHQHVGIVIHLIAIVFTPVMVVQYIVIVDRVMQEVDYARIVGKPIWIHFLIFIYAMIAVQEWVE